MERKYQNKQWLCNEIETKGRSRADVGREFNVSGSTIEQWARKFGIKSQQKKTTQQKFWEKVKKTNTCWEWQGAKDGSGYGCLNIKGTPKGTHRLAYEWTRGPIGELNVCHKCDNPACVRPDHLFLGTQGDNIRDCVSKNRLTTKKKVENTGTAVVTWEKVRNIRELWEKEKANGLSTSVFAKDIADEHGISCYSVKNIITKRTWKE